MTDDLDKSGRGFQRARTYLGPTIGWVDEQVQPSTPVTGTYTIQPGDSLLLVDSTSAVTINLPDVNNWIRQTANQPATGFTRVLTIKDFGGHAGMANITIAPFAAQRIDKVNAPIFITSPHGVFGLAPLVDLSGWTVVTGAGGPPPPPPSILTAPTAAATGLTTAALGVSTDTSGGTLFWVVVTGTTPPTSPQIVAGQDSTGAPAVAHGSQVVTAVGVQSVTASGLAPPTVYTAHFVQVIAGTSSNVASSNMFNTTFTAFSIAADRISMLHPAYNDGTNTAPLPYGVAFASSAVNVNQWIPGGSSTVPNNFVTLGALTTAPDGTNTAQKIVESNVNGPHNLVSGLLWRGPRDSGSISITQSNVKLRLSVFAKAAERTRIVLAMTDTALTISGITGFPGPSGVKAVFDLQAGTVAVPAAAFNRPCWIALPASITAFSNGWYRCTLDLITGFWQAGVGFIDSPSVHAATPILGQVYIDAGAGNAAENSSYAGNGTSGVYVWKSSCLPPSVWTLSHEFFEDFNNTAGVDINDTRVPGFNFYVSPHHMFGSADAQTLSARFGTDYDISSSTINMHLQDDLSTVQPWMASVVSDGTDTGYVGQVFGLPFLMEARMKVDAFGGGQNPVWWSDAAETLFIHPGNPWPPSRTTEYDFGEWNQGNTTPFSVIHLWDPSAALTTHTSYPPYPVEMSTPDFTQYHTYSNFVLGQAAGTPPSGTSRNILPNSSFAGAVVGSPGTLPTNSSISALPSGISFDVAAISAGKLQIRIHGTSSGGQIQFYLNSLPNFSSGGGTMLPGQIWTASIQLRYVSGTLTGEIGLVLQESNAAGNLSIGFPATSTVLTEPNPNVLTTVSATSMSDALNFRRYAMWVFFNVPGGVYDETFELFQPQLELSAMPTAFQNSFSTGDPAPIAGVAAVDLEPFFHRIVVFFDNTHVQNVATSTLTGLNGNTLNLMASTDSQHYVPIITVSSHSFSSHYDWVSVFTT